MASFGEKLQARQEFATSMTSNASSGTLSDVSTANTSYIRFTAASAINSFANPIDGKELTIINATGGALSIVNDSGGTAANRILTGTGGNVSLLADASWSFKYDATSSRWRAVGVGEDTGGGAGGGYTTYATEDITAGGTITIATTGAPMQWRRVQGDSSTAVTTDTEPFGTSAPADGYLITVVGMNDEATVTIPYSNTAKGCIINGDAILGLGATLTVVYDSTLDRYVEQSRNI